MHDREPTLAILRQDDGLVIFRYNNWTAEMEREELEGWVREGFTIAAEAIRYDTTLGTMHNVVVKHPTKGRRKLEFLPGSGRVQRTG